MKMNAKKTVRNLAAALVTCAAVNASASKIPLTITAYDTVKAYGEEKTLVGVFEIDYQVDGLEGEDTVSQVTLQCAGLAAAAACTEQGYPITVSDAQGTGLDKYDITYVPGTLTVTRRALTVTADNTNKVYGSAVDFAGTEFRITEGALADWDTLTNVTLTSEGAAAGAAAGGEGYAIVPSAADGVGIGNYSISYANGLLSVAQKALTVTANDRAKTYGDAVVFAGTEFTADGLANGDGVSTVTLASEGAAATAAYAAGGYPIAVSAAQGTGLANYAIEYVPGTLSVARHDLTVTANDRTKTYGDAVVFAGTEFTVDGLVNGDGVSTVTLASEGAAAAAAHAADGYPIAVSAAQGTGLSNYAISYADGKLSVTQKGLSITANDAVKTYGEEKHFAGTEFQAAGLVNGDAVTSVTLASEGAPAAAENRFGGYPIVASAAQGTGLGNYAISYADGTLRLSRAAITVTADDAAKAYGESLAFAGTEFTVDPATLPNGDRIESVTLTSADAADAATAVGVYPNSIVPSFAVTGIDTNNYEIAFSNGTLTVTQAILTVTANDAIWRVTRPRPTYYFADFSSQLLAGDTVADVTGGNGTEADVTFVGSRWETAEPTGDDVGSYPDEIGISESSFDGPRAENYRIAVSRGTLTVIPISSDGICDHEAADATEVCTTAATKYDGVLYADDAVAGTILVTVGKRNARSGVSKIKATVTLATGKKTVISGNYSVGDPMFSAKAKDGTSLSLVLGADGVYGTYGAYAVESARNRYSSKSEEDKKTVEDAGAWMGNYALVWGGSRGYNALSVAVEKKGAVKLSGTLASGKSVSIKGQMIIGYSKCCAPVIYSNGDASLAFSLEFSDAGLEAVGLDGAAFGYMETIAQSCPFMLDPERVRSVVEGNSSRELLADYLPLGAEVMPDGKKWIVMPDESGKAMKTGSLVWDKKTGSVDLEKSKIDGYNVSALKLTVKSGTGLFKGSFKVYFVEKNALKNKTATVSGVTMEGIGYGTAVISQYGSFPVTVGVVED